MPNERSFIYRPGYSFVNAQAMVPVTRPKPSPWVSLTYGPGPRTALSKKRRWGSNVLPMYRDYYRKSVKQRSYLSGIGEVPSDTEWALGQAPGPTDKPATVEREGWAGKLSNAVSKIGDIFASSTEKQTELSRQRTESILESLQKRAAMTAQIGGMNVPILLLVGGVALLVLVPMLTKTTRKRRSKRR